MLGIRYVGNATCSVLCYVINHRKQNETCAQKALLDLFNDLRMTIGTSSNYAPGVKTAFRLFEMLHMRTVTDKWKTICPRMMLGPLAEECRYIAGQYNRI